PMFRGGMEPFARTRSRASLARRAGRGLAALALALTAGAARAEPPDARGTPGFLTAPAAGDPLDIALGYLPASPARAGLAAGDLAGLRVSDRTQTRHNGLTHLYLRQRLAGIEVLGGDLSLSVAPDGRLLALHSAFVRDLAHAANARSPRLSPDD